MTAKMFLYVVLAFALAFGVSALGNVSIVENSVALSGNPGAINSSGIINVANIGTGSLGNIVVNATDMTSGSLSISKTALQFVPSALSLDTGASSPVAIILSLPSNQKAGTYTGMINAVFDASNQDSASLSVTVNAVPSYSASGNSPSLVQGLPGQLTVTVVNTGNADISGLAYAVSDTFVSGANLISPEGAKTGTVSVAYGASATFTVALSPGASQATGTYAGHVNLSYSGISQTVPLTFNIQSINRQLSASASSASVKVNRVGGFVQNTNYGTLTLNNTGNYPLSGVTVSASSLTGPAVIPSSGISFSDNGFALGVGAGKQVFVTPIVPASYASGTYSGTLTVSYGGLTDTVVPFSVVVADASASVSLSEVVYQNADRETNVSKSVTITNDGDFTLNAVTLTTSAPNTWITGSVPSTLAVGGSFTVTVTSTVPEAASSGTYKIGSLTFSSLEYSKSVDLKVTTTSMLVFDSVKISIDDGSFESVTEGGSADDDAKPGQKIELKVKLENLFSDDDMEISDISITATVYEVGEDGDDLEGESDEFDIDGSDKSSDIDVTFDDEFIDWEAETGSHTVEIVAEGEDDEGGNHKAYFNFTINIDREKNAEFIFTRFDVPSTISCGRSFTVYIDGQSVGEDNDDETVLKLDSPAIGVNVKKVFPMGAYNDQDCDALDDDEDDCNSFSYSETFQVPSNIAPGTYSLSGKLYRNDGSKQTDDNNVDIRVECGAGSGSSTTSASTSNTGSSSSTSNTQTTKPAAKPTNTESTSSDVAVLYSGSQGNNVPSKNVVASANTRVIDTTAKTSFMDSNGYLALLSVFSVAVIVGIIVLLIYGLTKPV